MKWRLDSVGTLAALACLATLALHAYPVARPMIAFDDFSILTRSLTWKAAWENLWLPANEHAMPLGRLSTAVLTHLAGRQTLFPFLAALQGPLALLAALGLLYLFVRRELGHPFYGLIAISLFGVTSIYHQAIGWFAASFSVLTLATLLLALVAGQRWRQTGRFHQLALCTLWAGLAPGWFASGVLAGPLCSLYLLTRKQEIQNSRFKIQNPTRKGGFGFWILDFGFCLLPLLGTAAFLGLSLPRTANYIMHLPHYGGETALQAFDPLVGLVSTGRSVVDNLTLGLVGISGIHCPAVLVPAVLAGLAVLVRWAWRPAVRRGFLVLGIGTILLSYFLVYGARAAVVPYEGNMHGTIWGRYHLLPQLGLTLLIGGALPGWEGRLFRLDATGGLTPPQGKALAWLIAILFLTQLPRDLFATSPCDPAQQEVLKRIETMDVRCRDQQIAAEDARAVLPSLHVPGCGDTENGWEFLRGSSEPRPHSNEEIRRILPED